MQWQRIFICRRFLAEAMRKSRRGANCETAKLQGSATVASSLSKCKTEYTHDGWKIQPSFFTPHIGVDSRDSHITHHLRGQKAVIYELIHPHRG